MKLEIEKHVLVPKHVKLTESEKKTLFEKYHISVKELPKINKADPAIAHLKAKSGDIIKIVRNSGIAGETIYYRGVLDG